MGYSQKPHITPSNIYYIFFWKKVMFFIFFIIYLFFGHCKHITDELIDPDAISQLHCKNPGVCAATLSVQEPLRTKLCFYRDLLCSASTDMQFIRTAAIVIADDNIGDSLQLYDFFKSIHVLKSIHVNTLSEYVSTIRRYIRIYGRHQSKECYILFKYYLLRR